MTNIQQILHPLHNQKYTCTSTVHFLPLAGGDNAEANILLSSVFDNFKSYLSFGFERILADNLVDSIFFQCDLFGCDGEIFGVLSVTVPKEGR